MIIDFTESALSDLDCFNKTDIEYIIKKLEYFASNYDILKTSKNVTPIVGHNGVFRYVIKKKIRAIYTIKNNKIEILILRISFRKNAYDDLDSL